MKISNKNPFNTFIHLLEMFRISRNKLVHGNPSFLGYFIQAADVKVTMNKLMNDKFTLKEIKQVFKVIKNREFVELNEQGYPSYLSIIFLVMTFFNSDKVNNKIFADIDYLIFNFRTSTNIGKAELLWKTIGLKVQWIKKINR